MSRRDPGDRYREIELEAAALVAWCDEFIGEVLDNNGVSLKRSGEWTEVLGDLRKALRPVEPWKPRMCLCGHSEAFHANRDTSCHYGTSSDGGMRASGACGCLKFTEKT